MDYLRGKIKSGSPCLLNDDITGSSADSWRTRSVLRRRDDIFSSAYSSPRLGRSSRSSALVSRFRSPSSSYQIKTSDTHKKYSESISPLDSPSLARSRKTSIVDSYLSREPVKEEETSDDSNNHNPDEVIDYKELYEKEKREKEECEAKMKELEKHLQIGLQRFLDLKKVLDSFQEEIEYSDDSINGFIQSIIPDFHSWAINAEAEENVDNKPNNQNKHDSSPSKEDTKEDISKNLVLPLVNYEWIDVAPSKPPLYVKHLKRFTNSFSSRTEKLKLNIHFAGDSRHLPTKIHIEIRDCKGRVVFR